MNRINEKLTFIKVIFIDISLFCLYLVFGILHNLHYLTDAQYKDAKFLTLGIAIFILVFKIVISINSIIQNVKEMESEEYQEKLEKTLYKLKNGGNIFDLEDIVKDYAILIKKKYKKAIKKFKIHKDDFFKVDVNDITIDLSNRHKMGDDYKNALFELEALLNDEVTRKMIEDSFMSKYGENTK